MTKVFYREYYDNIIINIEGHSGYAQMGSDVVCAGISTLTFALVNALLDEEAGGNIRLNKKIIDEGVVDLEIRRFSFSKSRIDGIISLAMTGFYMLEESYPDYVRIE